jgi:AraC-like DNA-binding protein
MITPAKPTDPGKARSSAISAFDPDLMDRPAVARQLDLADYQACESDARRTGRMPRECFNLPISSNPKIRAIANALTLEPSDRSTSAEWAKRVAMRERSLSRLMIRETGLTFGRWRQQLHLVVALRELASGAKVQNVAAELSCSSVNAFITMFKKGTREHARTVEQLHCN